MTFKKTSSLFQRCFPSRLFCRAVHWGKRLFSQIVHQDPSLLHLSCILALRPFEILSVDVDGMQTALFASLRWILSRMGKMRLDWSDVITSPYWRSRHQRLSCSSQVILVSGCVSRVFLSFCCLFSRELAIIARDYWSQQVLVRFLK